VSNNRLKQLEDSTAAALEEAVDVVVEWVKA
jgi:hypothetical protein